MRMPALLLAALLAFPSAAQAAEDDRLAYRLFEEGRFAEAAELFTDPAWKGAALYKSDQFWRAAEAFLRAGDAGSTYNLGNAYARLGYFELALEAYLRALAADPGNADAAANAELMRAALADRDKAEQGLQPQAREIDRVESSAEDEGDPGEGERGEAEEQRAGGEQGRTRDSDEAGAQSDEGDGGASEDQASAPQGQAGEGDVEGNRSEQQPSDQPSGGSEAADQAALAQSAGARARLETEQATEQWLNRITDDPGRFLKARIALEERRRAANGTAVKTEAEAW